MRVVASVLFLCAGCSEPHEEPRALAAPPPPAEGAPEEAPAGLALLDAPPAVDVSALDRDYPMHGLVTGVQLAVRARPDPAAPAIGSLRVGNRIRLKAEAHSSANCATGWHEIHPRGYACAGEGIEIAETPPESDIAAAPARDAPLPYTYWFVKEPMTPEFHRPPSRDERIATNEYVERWKEIEDEDPDRAVRFLAGELPNELEKPAIVHRFLDRGFVVAGTSALTRDDRRFVRTVRGAFVQEWQLDQRSGSDFAGVELTGGRTLPIVWTTREMHYRTRRDVGRDVRFPVDETMPPVPRQTIMTNWIRSENFRGERMHVLETPAGERYVRDWFLGIAMPIAERPRPVGDDDVWVHVDLSEQTLVLYRGDVPLYATLVSTGSDGFETENGLYRIQKKDIADTMANLGAGNVDAYRIEDVPWVQYFNGSIALHGTVWHSQFGVPRSHGCVNLSPTDARVVFDSLSPSVPDGWLGVFSGEASGFRGSYVKVTL